jgi:hypothetical protein
MLRENCGSQSVTASIGTIRVNGQYPEFSQGLEFVLKDQLAIAARGSNAGARNEKSGQQQHQDRRYFPKAHRNLQLACLLKRTSGQGVDLNQCRLDEEFRPQWICRISKSPGRHKRF